MHPNLTTIQDITQLELLLQDTRHHPLLLFKHSVACGTSAEALDELIAHLDGDAGTTRYAVIGVQTHREVSDAAAARLGVRHQSPQAILVHDGRAVWTASHFRVNTAEIRKALEALRPHSGVPAAQLDSVAPGS